MPSLPRTDREIAALAAPGDYWDAKTSGLVLRVLPTTKTWSWRYRFGGRRKRLSLGPYPAFSLKDAREWAEDQIRAVKRDGVDPGATLTAAQPAPELEQAFTFADLVRLYEQVAPRRKSTWQQDVRKINRWILPAWKDRPLRSITRADVHEVLDRAVATGLTVGVNRIQAVISRLFTMALDRSLVDAHPASRIEKRHREMPRDRVLSDDELRALWAGLEAAPGRAADVVMLRLLTGQRIGEELMPMRREELDLEAVLWTIPRERTKNRKQPHTVPLAATALRILERRCTALPSDEPRIFPGLNAGSEDYRALSTLKHGFEWIDLRRTVGTRLAGLGFAETTIGRVLNHAKVSVTARHYNQHAYDAEKRAALEAWDRELTRILERKPKTADVRPFAR